MQLQKIIALLLGITMSIVSVSASAAAKKTTQEKQQAVWVKHNYGVKGAKLTPTKVRDKTYSYRLKGKSYTTLNKAASRLYSHSGYASYYGGKFHGRKTASGEIYNKNAFTAAHKTLALGSYALVTNVRNGRKVIVRINDRGPFSKNRIIDLSVASAKAIGMYSLGVAKVKVEAIIVDANGKISGKGAETLQKHMKKAPLAKTKSKII